MGVWLQGFLCGGAIVPGEDLLGENVLRDKDEHGDKGKGTALEEEGVRDVQVVVSSAAEHDTGDQGYQSEVGFQRELFLEDDSVDEDCCQRGEGLDGVDQGDGYDGGGVVGGDLADELEHAHRDGCFQDQGGWIEEVFPDGVVCVCQERRERSVGEVLEAIDVEHVFGVLDGDEQDHAEDAAHDELDFRERDRVFEVFQDLLGCGRRHDGREVPDEAQGDQLEVDHRQRHEFAQVDLVVEPRVQLLLADGVQVVRGWHCVAEMEIEIEIEIASDCS